MLRSTIVAVRLRALRTGLSGRASAARPLSSCGSPDGTDHAPGVRVRFAPSPTGSLHLGGLRTALFNYLLARKAPEAGAAPGTMILRIEDTDRKREVAGSAGALAEVMEACGVEFDEGPPELLGSERVGARGGEYGPYVQSERQAAGIYREHADRLLAEGVAYRCFCSADRLAAMRAAQATRGEAQVYDRACAALAPAEVKRRVDAGEEHVVRLDASAALRVPTSGSAPAPAVAAAEGAPAVTLHDLVHGAVHFPRSMLDDQVLLKSDNFPTYHLASVVDDHLMAISHVVRGEEWLPSAPKHLALYRAFGWSPPRFAHLPLLLGGGDWAEDGSGGDGAAQRGQKSKAKRGKLSKRHGDASVESVLARGMLPAALLNFVALLGWNPGASSDQEVFTREELIEHFDIVEVNKSGAAVDRKRLLWLNSQHMRRVLGAECPSSSGDAEGLVVLEEGAEGIAIELARLTGGDAVDSAGGAALLTEHGAERVWAVMQLMREKARSTHEFGPLCAPFFEPPDLESATAQACYAKHWKEADEASGHPGSAALVQAALEGLRKLDEAEGFGNGVMPVLKALAAEHGVGLKHAMMPIRFVVTGMDVGAPLGDCLELLGRDTSLHRLECFTAGQPASR
jgi:glutamyl/glutaminyl-tRNA synthetase